MYKCEFQLAYNLLKLKFVYKTNIIWVCPDLHTGFHYYTASVKKKKKKIRRISWENIAMSKRYK